MNGRPQVLSLSCLLLLRYSWVRTNGTEPGAEGRSGIAADAWDSAGVCATMAAAATATDGWGREGTEDGGERVGFMRMRHHAAQALTRVRAPVTHFSFCHAVPGSNF
jgi:hypothetical protein